MVKIDRGGEVGRRARAGRQRAGAWSFAAWQRNLTTLIRKLKGRSMEPRLRVRVHLGELIEKVGVFSEGHAERGGPK
jgi:hypothetical protein